MFRCFNFDSGPLGVQAVKESEQITYRIIMDQKGNRGKAVYNSCICKNYETVIHPEKEEGGEVGQKWQKYERGTNLGGPR